MCLGSLNLRKKKGKNKKKDKKEKNKSKSRGIPKNLDTNSDNSSLNKDDEIREITSSEQRSNNENQPVQEKQDNKENVEGKNDKDISSSTASSLSLPSAQQPNNLSSNENKNVKDISSSTASAQPSSSTASTPGITITPAGTTTGKDDTQIIEIQVSDNNDNNENNDIDNDQSKSEGNNKHYHEMSVKNVTGRAALQLFKTSLAAAKPFAPWIESVSVIIDEIVNQYDTIVYNKKTCLILIERVELINLSVKNLTRRREENSERFQNENYYLSFIKLQKALRSVKEFISDISQLKGYRKFILASEVKVKANQYLRQLDDCCNELQFTIIISNETRIREQQSLDEDVVRMTKFLKSIDEGVITINSKEEKTIEAVNRIHEHVSIIQQMMIEMAENAKKSQSNTQTLFNAQIHDTATLDTKGKTQSSTQTLLNAPIINPKDLYDTATPEDTPQDNKNNGSNNNNHRNKLKKKLLRNTIPVACKDINIPDSEARRTQAHLSILNSIQSSSKIIKFHGKSDINGGTVLVFDWAEHGNLKGLYGRVNLSWVDKLDIAHDIANGLVFLQACSILHHDIKCENILITGDSRYEAKIANFGESREDDQTTIPITTYGHIIRWLAPEKIPKDKNPVKEKYTFKCEIFSFGMLLWELGAQKLPYEKMEMEDISVHVLAKRRESFEEFNKSNNGLNPDNNKKPIVKGFIRIIESAWTHESNQRPTINDIYQELDDLVGAHSPRISPKYSSNGMTSENSNNNNFTTETSEEDDDLNILPEILTLEDGISAHKRQDREKAWECFNIHATLDDPVAIYWKAYYYLKGYVVNPNTNEAIKCFKQAADCNVPDAQYYYANALQKAKKPGFLEYFIKAADNGHSLAQRELGRIYYYGNGVEANEEKGIQYLKSAALKNNSHAIEDLKKIDSNLLVQYSI